MTGTYGYESRGLRCPRLLTKLVFLHLDDWRDRPLINHDGIAHTITATTTCTGLREPDELQLGLVSVHVEVPARSAGWCPRYAVALRSASAAQWGAPVHCWP